jgi:TolB protein
MPRTITRRYTTFALAAFAALTFWPSTRVASVALTSAAAPPAQTVSRFEFSAASYRVSEADGGATITVLRTGDTGREAAVEYLADSGYLLAKGCGYPAWVGSATPGADYTRTSGTLRFAAGETSKTFRVPVNDDTLIESRQPETVLLSLDFSAAAQPSGEGCYGAASTLFIHDDDPAPAPTPTPAPSDKRKIAFGSNRDGNYEIYVMDEDGAAPRRLTNNLGNDSHPTWSPDGTRIAFVSERDGSNGVYVMNADGTNLNRLAAVPLGASDPVWSPDGTRIAFVSWRAGFSSEVYVVNIEGGGAPLNVTNNPQEDFGPAWSPDGRRLAFTSRRDNGTFSVYTVNADGTGTRRVVEGYSRDPAWSPDGSRIAYVAEGAQPGANIYVVNADGTGKKFLSGDRAFTFDLSPAWSSDGARIAFVSNRDGNAGNYEIYVMNADGSGQTRLTNNNAHENLPAWQPQAAAHAPTAPVLLTEPNTSWAVALDSVTHVADPFPVVSSSNFSADRRTRVALFAAGITSPTVADIKAEAEDSAGRRYQLPVEYAATVPGVEGMTQVVVRLTDDLDGLGHVWVSLNVRGTLTNKAVFTIQNKQ